MENNCNSFTAAREIRIVTTMKEANELLAQYEGGSGIHWAVGRVDRMSDDTLEYVMIRTG